MYDDPERCSMILVRLKGVVCHDQTEDDWHGISPGDEPYVTVSTVGLTTPPQGPPIPTGARTVLHVIEAPMFGGGRPSFGTPGDEFESCWGLDGLPHNLTNPDDVIFLVSLMEHDSGDPGLCRGAVQSAVGASLAATATAQRPGKVVALIDAIDTARRLPTGGVDFDDPIDAVKELRFSAQQLQEAAAGGTVRRSLDFEGGSGRYTLEFEATIPRLNARAIEAMSSMQDGTSLFILDADGAIQTKYFDPRVLPRAWSRWSRLTPPELDFRRPVRALSTMPGGSTLFVVGEDSAVWSAYCAPASTTWTDWFRLCPPGACDSVVVAALSTVPGGTSLYVVDGDGHVRTRFFDPTVGQWMPPDDQPWLDLSDGHLVGGPSHNVAAVSTVPGGSSLFMVDDNLRLHTRAFDPRVDQRNWGPWQPMSGPQQANHAGQLITAVSPVEGATYLFMVQSDGSVGHRFFDPRRAPDWSSWRTISPAQFTTDVRAVCTGGEVHAFAVDERNAVRYWHEPTDDWTQLSSPSWAPGGLAAVTAFPGEMGVYVVDEAGGVRRTYRDPRFRVSLTWVPWHPV